MILDRLRETTRPAHEQLEAHVDLLNRPWSLPFYRQLLGRFYGFYAALEPAILNRTEWGEQNYDVAPRRKIHLLEEDLRFLGLSDTEIKALPHDENAPLPHTFAQALGSAYVLEGSTLGGQIITRHLHKVLGVEPERGCSFFYSYGREVGPMWKEFVTLLNSYPLSEPEQGTLIQSACDTFSGFDIWLGEVL